MFIENSIVQLKEQDKKEAKGINLRRIIGNTQLYVKACLKYKSQLGARMHLRTLDAKWMQSMREI